MGVTRDAAASGAIESLLRLVAEKDSSDQSDADREELQRLAACGEAVRALSFYCGAASSGLPPEFVSAQLNRAFRVFRGERESFSSEDFAIYFLAHLHQDLQQRGVRSGIRTGAMRYLAESARRFSPDIAKLAVHGTTWVDEEDARQLARQDAAVPLKDRGHDRPRRSGDNTVAAVSGLAVAVPPSPSRRERAIEYAVSRSKSGGKAVPKYIERDLQGERRSDINRRRAELEDRLKLARQFRGLKILVAMLIVGFLVETALLLINWT